MVDQVMEERHGLLLKENQNNSRQRGRTLLRRLDNSVMRTDTDPDVFFSEGFHLCDELSDLDEVVFNERFTTIVLDTLPEEKILNS